MLNTIERLKIFQFLRIYSIVGLLPTQADLSSTRLYAPSIKKKCLSALGYGLFVLHALYKNGGLFYAYFCVPNVQLYQLVIHFILAMGSAIIVFWYYSVYVQNPALFFGFVNITLLGTTGGPVDPKDGSIKHWKARMREYSLQDLVARGLPYMITLAVLVTNATMVYDPTMSLLLYAALPLRLQNWVTFGLCLLEEIRFMLVMVSVAIPIWEVQLISFDLVCNQLHLVTQGLQNGGRRGIRSTYRYLRCLQLYVTLLNNVNSYLIFTWKLGSISIGIASGFAAVAHFRERVVFGIMYYVFFADAVLIYTLMYEKAFKIPQLFDRAASSALLHNRGNQRDGMRRHVLSIPPAGVKVGNFHKMERASTLIYANFVLSNIVNMLVAYA